MKIANDAISHRGCPSSKKVYYAHADESDIRFSPHKREPTIAKTELRQNVKITSRIPKCISLLPVVAADI